MLVVSTPETSQKQRGEFVKTIYRYLGKDFLITFFVTLLVFTFVMYIGAVLKAIDLMSRGIEGRLIFRIFLSNIPYILSFTIPVSTLTAVLLLFSRLSFDGEITALKASGLTMWKICAPVVFLAVLLSAVCIYINSYAAPNSHFARKKMLHNIGLDDPLELLEEGRFVKDFPGISIYVGKRAKNRVFDVVVYELDHGVVKQRIRAESGVITPDYENERFVIDLYKVRIDETTKDGGEEGSRYISADHSTVPLNYGEMRKKRPLKKRTRSLTMPELIGSIQDIRSKYPDLSDSGQLRRRRAEMVVEVSERLAMSFACISFALLGIPLGMKSRRKDSSAGIALSLVFVFVFYFFVILADTMVDKPSLRPEMIVWIPVIIAQYAGIRLIQRCN